MQTQGDLLLLRASVSDARFGELDNAKFTRNPLTFSRSIIAKVQISMAAKKFNGVGLTILKNMPHLEVLSLGSCPALTDKAFVGLSDLKIKRLSLSGAGITDKSLEVFAQLPRLTSLQLSGTNITDAGLTRLSGNTTLVNLNLSKTKITDVGIGMLADLKQLETLWIGKTGVTQKGIESLKSQISGLSVFDL